MTILSLVSLLMGCGPRIARIEPIPVGARDGAIIVGAELSLPIIGLAKLAPGELFDLLRANEPSLVLLTGDSVSSSKIGEWQRLTEVTRDLPVLPVVGQGERTRDPHLRGFHAVWDGLGVEEMSGEVSWYAVDLHSQGARWRLVILDSDREALGHRWIDQGFWIPKVVGDRGYDHLIVALCGGPGRLDVEETQLKPEVAELMSLVRRHSDPTRLLLWISGGGHAPGMVLPGGRWGEGWLTTGRSSGPAVPLLYGREGLKLAPGMQQALIQMFESRSGEVLEELQTSRGFPPQIAPVAGWWELSLSGHELILDLHLSAGVEETSWPVAYQLSWSVDRGWESIPTSSLRSLVP